MSFVFDVFALTRVSEGTKRYEKVPDFIFLYLLVQLIDDGYQKGGLFLPGLEGRDRVFMIV